MDGERVLFIDGEALVIDKPAGLAVDRPRDGGLSLANHMDSLLFGFRRWPTAVHRLDRDTSGCLLLARNPKAHVRFARTFEEGVVAKTYLAVLDGVPAEKDGIVDLSLGKTSSARSGWRIVPDPQGKRAVTRWRVVAERDGRALVEMTPETGRTHQLRVHAASGLGLPILGDPVYGRADARGLFLHAARLTVPRPPKPEIVASAPLPERFAALGFGDD